MIITNERHATTRDLITRYARRMTSEQRLGEAIRALCADALFSTVNLNVSLTVDLTSCSPCSPKPCSPRCAPDCPAYATVIPETIQDRFLETPGTIIASNDTITVRLECRAYTLVLRAADLPAQAPIPWLGNRTIRDELT